MTDVAANSQSVDMWRLSPSERQSVLADCQARTQALQDFLAPFPGVTTTSGGTIYVEGSFHDGERLGRVVREYMAGERRFVVRSGCNYFIGEATPLNFTAASLFHDEGYGAQPDRIYRCNEVWSLRQFLASRAPHHAALKAELEAHLALPAPPAQPQEGKSQ